MKSIYEKLFEGYAIPVLQDLDRYYDEEALTAQLERLALSKDTSSQLEELFYDCYLQWSTDAFALGLHLGLSLLHDEIRRLRPQQV